MKKIDIKKALEERVQSTEWTDKNTWNVLERIRATGKTREKRRLTFLIPAAALVILAVCIGITSIIHPGTPDLIRPTAHTVQPLAISNHDGPSAYEESIRKVLTDRYSALADELVPVDLYCETDGIRITVDSALIKGAYAYILFTAQDLEGDRINQSMGYSISVRDDAGNLWKQKSSDSLAYSPEEHKATFIAYCRTDGTVIPGVHKATVSIQDIRFCETTRVDLLPMLGQYAPADRDGIAETDVPLYKTASLTGIGWNGDTLRVQVRTSDEDALSLAYTEFGCSVRNNNRYMDIKSGDEGYEYISRVYPYERDQVTELAVYFREFPEMAEGPWEPEFNISVPGNGETEESERLSDAEAAVSSLRTEYPDIAEGLRPVNLECTKQGIRMEIVSALVKGRSSWILWTMQDLEGDRINETSASIFNHPNNIGEASDYIYCYKAYNAEEKRLTVLEEIRYDTMNEPEDGLYLLEANGVYIYEDETVDLKPVLERYRNTAEGVDPPAGAWPYHNGIQGDPVPQDLKVLDFENPANVPLTEKGNLLLTGIGWINGELHVQIHEADPAFCETYDDGISLIRRNSVAVSNCSGEGEPFGCSGDSPYAWNGPGGRWDEWLEFVLGSAPEDEETMTLTAELSYATRTVRDEWEFRIPASAIRDGGGPEDSGAAVPPLVDEVDTMSLSFLYARIPDNLTPVGISCEKDGIRMTVHSVLAEGQEVSVLVFLRDLESDRINLDTSIQAELADGTESGWEYAGCNSMEYDTEKHIYAKRIHFRTESVSDPGAHTATLTLGDLSFYERTKLDLGPLVKQYAPADGEGIAEVDIPLHETVTLTGIGWSDGQLFIKFRGTTREFPMMTCKVPAADSDGSPGEKDRLIRQTALPGDDSSSINFEATMNISPDDIDRMKLNIDFKNPTGTVENTWEFMIPASAIRTEEKTEKAETAETESMQAETGSTASGVGMSAYNDHVLRTLKDSYPELAEELRPVNTAFEKDRIRLEVLSAVVLGKNAYVLYTLQDMKGDLDTSYMRGTPSLTEGDGTAYMVSWEGTWGYNAEERKIAFLDIFTTEDAFSPGDHTVSLSIRDINFYESTQAGGEIADVAEDLREAEFTITAVPDSTYVFGESSPG